MIVIGIDIGLSGAIAVINPDGTCKVDDLPVVDGRIHGRQLLDLLRLYVPAGDGALVVLEDVQARPQANGGVRGNTMHSQGSLMRSRGIVEAVLDIAGRMEVHWAQPQAWKRWYGLKRPAGAKDHEVKELSRQMALRLYPSAGAVDLARKKDHNRAEAILIAHYGLTRIADGPAPDARVRQPKAGQQQASLLA